MTRYTALLLFIDALAVARLARLVTTDELPLVRKPREWVQRRWGARRDRDERWPATLISCSWCSSMYVGAGVLSMRVWWESVWWPVAVVLAFSEVAGLLASWEGE